MKKGFTLLETIIVIAFLSVALLLIYNSFINMINNSKKNILYDDVSKIYETYYLKEYLALNNLEVLLDNEDIKEINCSNFNSGCSILKDTFDVNKIYIVKYGLNNIDDASSSLNNYLKSLSNKDDFEYRLVAEFNNEVNYSYASIAFNGDNNE